MNELEKIIDIVGPNKFYEFWDLVNEEVAKNGLFPSEYYESFVDVKNINPEQPCGDKGEK